MVPLVPRSVVPRSVVLLDSAIKSDSDAAAGRTARGLSGRSWWEVGFEGADGDPGIAFMRNNLAVLTYPAEPNRA